MAFKFNWTTFDDQFIEYAKDQLTEALNKGIKTEMIGNIKVKELYMGTKPPDLEVLEIGDLSEEKFKGIFKITYKGDAHLVFQTTVQVNPLVVTNSNTIKLGNGIVAANHPLVVPMQLKISDLKLRGIAALVLCSNKGVTFCFKNDPLENIEVSSSFDNVPTIRKFVKKLIKTQISSFLLEDVPSIIHNYSLKKLGNKNTPKESIPLSSSSSFVSNPSQNSAKIASKAKNIVINNNNNMNGINKKNEGLSSSSSSININSSINNNGNDIKNNGNSSNISSNGSYISNDSTLYSNSENFEEPEKAWNRKWIGNDLIPENSTSYNQLFENGIILNQGLKCLKVINANKGILRLLYPFTNNYLCQSVNIDSWLLSPPFSPIPLYIPRMSFYTTYTKDKHFSILDYIRRTAITKAKYYGENQNQIQNNQIINRNQSKIQQQQNFNYWDGSNPERCDSETLFSVEMANHSLSPMTMTMANSAETSAVKSSSQNGQKKSNSGHENNEKPNYNYVHTYHRAQTHRKIKFSENSNQIDNGNDKENNGINLDFNENENIINNENQNQNDTNIINNIENGIFNNQLVNNPATTTTTIDATESKTAKGIKRQSTQTDSGSSITTLYSPTFSSFNRRSSFNNNCNIGNIVEESFIPTSTQIPEMANQEQASTSASSDVEANLETNLYLNYYQQRFKTHSRSNSIHTFSGHYPGSNNNNSDNNSCSNIIDIIRKNDNNNINMNNMNTLNSINNNNNKLNINNNNLFTSSLFNNEKNKNNGGNISANTPSSLSSLLNSSSINNKGNNNPSNNNINSFSNNNINYVTSPPPAPLPPLPPLPQPTSTMTTTTTTPAATTTLSSLMYNNNLSSGYSSDGESTVCEEFPSEIVIEPSNNSMAAQLTNLMNSNQTISPYTRTLEHFAYRSFPHSKPANNNSHKRRSFRQRHRLKIRVDGLMNKNNNNATTSTSTTTTTNAANTSFSANTRKPMSQMDDIINDLSELNF